MTATLPRRAFLGLAPTASNVVGALAPDGPAARAGVRVGDVVASVDDTPVGDAADLRARLGDLRDGDVVRLTLLREGRSLTVEVTAAPRPVEAYEGLRVRLGVAYSGVVRLRTIAVSPEGDGPWPCVYFLPGYACGTVERAAGAPSNDGLRALVERFARAGFVVWRIEKRGAGDSDGPPCADAGFVDERDDLVAGMDALARDPAVDAGNVFLFGHSLGALHAPFVAARAATRAMALYGAGSRTWLEYLCANARSHCARASLGAVEAERAVRATERFWHEVILAERSVDEAMRRHPELGAYRDAFGLDAASRPHGRVERYWREVYRTEVMAPLLAAGAPVLALWGTDDGLSSRVEHEELAAATGGRFEAVEGADHAFLAGADAVANAALRWFAAHR